MRSAMASSLLCIAWLFLTRGPIRRNFTDAEIDDFLASPSGRQLAQMTRYTAVGTPAEVKDYLESFAKEAGADEDRIHSVELIGAP